MWVQSNLVTFFYMNNNKAIKFSSSQHYLINKQLNEISPKFYKNFRMYLFKKFYYPLTFAPLIGLLYLIFVSTLGFFYMISSVITFSLFGLLIMMQISVYLFLTITKRAKFWNVVQVYCQEHNLDFSIFVNDIDARSLGPKQVTLLRRINFDSFHVYINFTFLALVLFFTYVSVNTNSEIDLANKIERNNITCISNVSVSNTGINAVFSNGKQSREFFVDNKNKYLSSLIISKVKTDDKYKNLNFNKNITTVNKELKGTFNNCKK